MEPPAEPRHLSTSELADELHHLLLECRRDPRLHEVMQALVLMSIGEVAHSDLEVDLEPGESIADTLRQFWRIAYLQGFEDGLKGGADGNR